VNRSAPLRPLSPKPKSSSPIQRSRWSPPYDPHFPAKAIARSATPHWRVGSTFRKALGRHEIATVQTTSIDQEAGLIRLTTVLAHSSGEWVSSDWPICPVGETAAPHKLGAALTYARRYALFTLVGIAGEDDLDAPDLPGMKLAGGTAGPSNREKPNGHTGATDSNPPDRKGLPHKLRAPVPILDAEASAAMRDRLAAGIAGLGSVDVAVEWARGSIAAKNTLTAADASDRNCFSGPHAGVGIRSGRQQATAVTTVCRAQGRACRQKRPYDSRAASLPQ
jgi:hypothetical protein